MKSTIITILAIVLIIGGIIGLSYAFGWIGVHQTETIYAAKQDAKRKVFEQTQSYVEGKRQSALKYYKEYQNADESGKQALKNIVSQDFANFDEDKYLSGFLRDFIRECKYKSN
ncbi:MAG: hypothetical protein KGZ71_09975 [Desulfobulbaceae bacterium]|nr:hypothetical protein [Candidatus Kapabacteria bacterium]MBS4000795.1 hypothetical protein [Desulfobulbaceae bacterium]